MARKKSKGKHAKKSRKPYSTLDEHKRQGPQLIPPLATLPGLHHSSWINERLPDLLWCALLVVHLGQDLALEVFRRVAKLAEGTFETLKGDIDLGHTGLSRLPEPLREQIVHLVSAAPGARDVLRSLLLLDQLPARDLWAANLAQVPTREDWNTLARAVGHVFDHQSQEATDCRWARIIFKIVAGQAKFATARKELVEELLYYPHRGDQRRVRPSVRAMEIAYASGPGVTKSDWPDRFWNECWIKTPCAPRALAVPYGLPRIGTTATRLTEVSEALATHFLRTTKGTALDARHEAVFGIPAYCLAILNELMRLGNAATILGRTGLRAILESYITLAYLLSKDSDELWRTYRRYGAGQAKLALLKLDAEDSDKAGYVSVDFLNLIANEDQSLEFLTVDVGHWERTNLRQMSEQAGVKPLYDRFYPWTSAYVHANWGAVRSSEFDLCLNPLHRAHRVLRTTATPLDDVVADACELTDRVLDLLERAYPGLTLRLAGAPTGGTA